MVEGNESQVRNSRVEGSRESHSANPDLRADALLKESRPTTHAAERPNVVTPDGKQLEFSNIFAQHQGLAGALGQHADHTPQNGQTGDTATPGGQNGQTADRTATPGGQNGQGGTDKSVQDKAATLFNKDTTDEQKLATVKELANAGITNLNYRDASGQDHKLRLETEAAGGSKQMVHLFESGADGKEHTALRGISRADGTFQHEQDRSGHEVDFKGKGYSRLMSDQPDAPAAVRPEHGDQPHSRGIPGQDTPVHPTVPSDAPVRPSADAPVRPQQSTDNTNGGDRVPPVAPSTDLTFGGIDRSQFTEQLKNPRVMAAFAGRMNSEVGTQGPAAHLAFAEEVMNRAASRNQSLMQALSGSYYPTPNPGRSNNPEYIAAINKAYHDGTDTIHGATGNASGHVGFGVRGGHYDAHHRWVSPNQTANIGGERFGHEQVDIDRGWLDKYGELKQRGSIASRERTNGDSAGRV